MKRERVIFRVFVFVLCCALWGGAAFAQDAQVDSGEEEEFGPVVRAYLGYLKGEQEVVDDRVSRREISPAYYRRNSNRIRALRQIAIRIARETQNDYLPELEAATRDEMKNLFERPPSINALRVGEVINNTFRYLGTVRAGELFYIFTRLDPYEQAELMRKEKRGPTSDGQAAPAAQPAAPTASTGTGDETRPRRASSSP
jgi:hypothetical protein